MGEDNISDLCVAKSDQLNADDLVGGPIVVVITGVQRTGAADQPLAVHIDGRQPWKPCKSMRRVLVHAWGPDATKYVGRSVRLFRDETVKWGGEAVGGIRVSGLSHIAKPLELALTTKKGTKAKFRVDVLRPSEPPKEPPVPEQADIAALRLGVLTTLRAVGQKPERLARYVKEQFGRNLPPLDTLTAEQCERANALATSSEFAAWCAEDDEVDPTPTPPEFGDADDEELPE